MAKPQTATAHESENTPEAAPPKPPLSERLKEANAKWLASVSQLEAARRNYDHVKDQIAGYEAALSRAVASASAAKKERDELEQSAVSLLTR